MESEEEYTVDSGRELVVQFPPRKEEPQLISSCDGRSDDIPVKQPTVGRELKSGRPKH